MNIDEDDIKLNIEERAHSNLLEERLTAKIDAQLYSHKLNPSDNGSTFVTSQRSGNSHIRLSSEGGGDMQIDPSTLILSPSGDMRRTFYQRTFSKVGPGSLRGSIFSLCASAIGSGVLSLPYVLGLCGYALGISFVVVGAIAALWSNKILAKKAI